MIWEIPAQIKIKGYRVESVEVESALSDFAPIKQEIVQSMEGSSGEQQLVAYLVLGNDPGPSVSDIRNFSRQKLPDHMVPQNYVFLDTLPYLPGRAIASHRDNTLRR
ncbi:MAG: hypothetical protein O2913_13320 [Chloroflexi bacterium]|nr:hypothetical protein [Chloroflexota bacterium]